MIRLSFLFVLTWASLVGATPTTQPLAGVKTLSDLETQPLVTLPSGAKVRIGLTPLDETLGPWRVAYCLEEETGTRAQNAPEKADHQWEELGPLRVRTAWASDCGMAVMLVKRAVALHRGPTLHQRLLPLLLDADAVIRVAQDDGSEWVSPRMDFRQTMRSPWRQFAEAVSREDGDKRPWAIVAAEGYPVVPVLADAVPVPFSGPGLQPATRPVVPLGVPEPALELTLEDNAFVIKSGEWTMANNDVDALAARWWVDGKPAYAPADLVEAAVNAMGVPREERPHTFRVAFGLPADLAKLKPGTRIGLQVMYSEAGFSSADPRNGAQDVKNRAQHEDARNPVPWAISQRLDFVLTREMLKAKE